MPQRLLRPGITTSRRFNALDFQGQSFFVRLITIVDDYGRCEADISLLASLCFPMYRADGCQHGADICQRVADICQQMSAQGMAVFYEVDGTKYLQLSRWKERTRSESRHPAPPAVICQTTPDICQQMIASPPQPQPQPQPSSTPLDGVSFLFSELGPALFKRKPGAPATEPEQRAAVGVIKRPDWKQELQEILTFDRVIKQEDRKFKFPGSLGKLLDEWPGYLDKARAYTASGTNGKARHIFDELGTGHAGYKAWRSANPTLPESRFNEEVIKWEDSRDAR